MLIFVLLVVFVYYFYITYVKPLSYWKKKGIVYEKPLPFIGNYGSSLLGRKHVVDIQMDLYKKYSNCSYIGMYQFSKPVLMIRDVDLIKRILNTDFDHFVDHSGFGSATDPIMNKALFNMKGQNWKEMRATLSPAFTISKIKNMFLFIAECAENLQKSVPMDQGVVEYNIRCLFSRFTNDVIASTSFGIKCDSIRDPENEFYRMGKRFTNFNGLQSLKFVVFTMFPFFVKTLKCRIISKDLIDYFHGIVQETVARRVQEKIHRPDVIHLLMEARKGKLSHEENCSEGPCGFATVEESDIGKSGLKKIEWTNEDFTAQILFFFLAGFETVASTASYLAYELAVNQDVQDKLHDEIDGVLEEFKKKVPYERITHMKYLDQIVAETLRKWAPAFETDRQCTKDYVVKPKTDDDKEFIIEKGTSIMIPNISIHRNPDFYPNADQFDPDRFSDENKKNILPGTYMPFGGGPRNCIGSKFALMEIKVLIFYLLAKFDVVPTAKTIIPYKLDSSKITLIPDKMYLGLSPRKLV